MEADKNFDPQLFVSLVIDLRNRIRDELPAHKLYYVRPELVEYYERPDQFGEAVSDRFPDSISDIENAGKCIALGQNTAAVFHLMRAVEAGVWELAEKLGATISNKHGETLCWGVLLSNIKAKIDALPKGEDQDEWYQAHAILHSVNRAWRTKTAHPKAVYTREEAETAFNASKTFMQFMAERISGPSCG